MIDQKEAIELLLQTGRAQQEVRDNIAGDPFFITPSGVATGLKGFYPPRRIEQSVTLLDAGSFISYVNAYKRPQTVIFADVTETGCTLTAVLDYHAPPTAQTPELPMYCRHKATFTAIETPEWKIWKAANRQSMSQVEFATWLEDNLHLFVQPLKEDGTPDKDSPTPAELLELIRSLHGHQNARFNTALRLDNGAFSVSYDEDVVVKGTTTTRSEALELPKQISAGFAIFQGAVKYAVTARLKTRCNERKLVVWFETIALHVIVRESIMALVKQVGEQTNIVPLLGKP